jgi:hypothetical protein
MVSCNALSVFSNPLSNEFGINLTDVQQFAGKSALLQLSQSRYIYGQ